MKTKFTKLEWELITDRPEDCIVEAHIDTHPDDPVCKWSKNELEDKVQSLFALSPGDEIDISDPLTFSIIEDCIDGGTIMHRCNPHCTGYDEFLTSGKWRAMVRAANSIAKKTGVSFYWYSGDSF
tara:strand:+ start:3836 stop:4210 length:375 start_codon:yes stop_codon:yes gene_type:complete